MKKLFKKGIASVLATAIAMSSMIISASAVFSADTTKSVVAGATANISISTKEGTVTATSSDKTVATVAIDGANAVVTGVAEGTATITLVDDKGTADNKDDDVTVKCTVTVTAANLDVFVDPAKGEPNKASSTKGVEAFINGYKQKSPAVDYKAGTLYLGTAPKGKYVVALSTSSTAAPTVTNGKPAVDAAAAEFAKATIKDNNVIVTANKKAGSVYAYVYDIKDNKVVAKSAAALVTVKTAANIVSVYAPSDVETNGPKADAKAIKSGVVPSNGTAQFKVYGCVKDNTVAITDNKFVISVPEKSRSLIQVLTSGSGESATYGNSVEVDNKAAFTIKAASLKADSKGKVKAANATVDVINKQSGKKTSLKLVIVNSLTDVNNTDGNSGIKQGYASVIDEKGDVSKYDVVFGLDDTSVGTTDKVTVAVLGKQAAFDTTKGKQTEKASKLYAAKLQQTDKGTFRARITAKADKKSDATEKAYVYIVATDAAKNVTYYEVATIDAKTGTVTKATTVNVYVNGVKQGSGS